MPDAEEEIIREQAEQIDELQNQLVQVYDELYQKQKHKRHSQDSVEKGFHFGWSYPQPLHFVNWFWSGSGQLADYAKHNPRPVRIRDCWKLAAFLTYFPIGIGLAGFVLGATPVPVNGWLRLALAILFMPFWVIAWLATAELQHHTERQRAGMAAFLISFVFVFLVCIPYLGQDISSGPNCGLLFVGLVSAAHAGLMRGITDAITGPNYRKRVWDFNVGPHITATVLLLGTLFSTTLGHNSSEHIGDFFLSMVFLAPLLSPLVVAFILVLWPALSYKMIWMRKDGEYLSTMLLRFVFQIVILAGWGFLYAGLIAFSLLGGLIV